MTIKMYIVGDVEGTMFSGNRYMLNGDTAIMILLDKNGFIAGIQAGVSNASIKYTHVTFSSYVNSKVTLITSV